MVHVCIYGICLPCEFDVCHRNSSQCAMCFLFTRSLLTSSRSSKSWVTSALRNVFRISHYAYVHMRCACICMIRHINPRHLFMSWAWHHLDTESLCHTVCTVHTRYAYVDSGRDYYRYVIVGFTTLTSALFSKVVAEFNLYGILIFEFQRAPFSNNLL